MGIFQSSTSLLLLHLLSVEIQTICYPVLLLVQILSVCLKTRDKIAKSLTTGSSCQYEDQTYWQVISSVMMTWDWKWPGPGAWHKKLDNCNFMSMCGLDCRLPCDIQSLWTDGWLDTIRKYSCKYFRRRWEKYLKVYIPIIPYIFPWTWTWT